MKKRHFLKKTVGLAVVASLATLMQAQAANMAEASGIMADIAVMAVQAKSILAAAANSGDVDAIADAKLRAEAVDAALAEALQAFAAYENATDDDAAAAAEEDLATAKQKAEDALAGAVPEPSKETKHDAWKESQKNTGGGPGRAYDPPNIYDRPWHSQGLRHFYQGVFGNAWSASSHGGSHVFGDRDATPE